MSDASSALAYCCPKAASSEVDEGLGRLTATASRSLTTGPMAAIAGRSKMPSSVSACVPATNSASARSSSLTFTSGYAAYSTLRVTMPSSSASAAATYSAPPMTTVTGSNTGALSTMTLRETPWKLISR